MTCCWGWCRSCPIKTPSDKWTAAGFLTSGATGAAAGVVGFGAGKALAAGGSKVIGMLARDAAEGGESSAASSAASSVARACSVNSFTGGTAVLLASGARTLIRDVKVGDTVLAADPQTGRSEPHRVTKVIVHGGKHTMVDVTLADGTTVTATDRHPFWDATTGHFTFAIDLKPGDRVRQADGTLIQITNTRAHDEDLTAYNLTVEGIHTYYAGTTPILVHNSCGDEAAGRAVRPYEVGTYNELRARSMPGDQLDIHHVPQGRPAADVIPGYDYEHAPAIALPQAEHRLIPNLRGQYAGTAVDLVSRDLGNLRDYTNASEEAIEELSRLIRTNLRLL